MVWVHKVTNMVPVFKGVPAGAALNLLCMAGSQLLPLGQWYLFKGFVKTQIGAGAFGCGDTTGNKGLTKRHWLLG
jgi:hypothetical protein